jgi:hypothetical protein
MRSLKSAALALSLLALCCSAGCATIVQGRHQEVTINSNPPGAAFEVGGISGTTPAVVALPRKQKYHSVIISKPGYETAEVLVGRQINPSVAGNISWGLL